MKFTYLHQPPKRYTFEQPLLKLWTESNCVGIVLNLFAGKVKLNVKEIRNDLDPEMPADFHKEAFKFIAEWDGDKFDTIIFDPPYNLRKSREKYQGRYFGSLLKLKDIMPTILNVGGIIISYGYDTVGMGRNRGFEKRDICIVCHGGDHNDTLCVIEEYIQPQLFINNPELYESIKYAKQ